MAILIDRMKIFSFFVMRYFTIKPRTVSLAIFVMCFFNDLPSVFSFKIVSFGTYYYNETSLSNNTDKNERINTLYYATSSDFSLTFVGKIVLGITYIFFNQFLTLVLGVALNIVSFYQFKSYLREQKRIMTEHEMISFSCDGKTREPCKLEQINERDILKRQAEKNMLYMALALCSISILSRVFLMFSYIYFFLFFSFASHLYVAVIYHTLHTLEPIFNILVFYSFNKMFKEEFNQKMFRIQAVPEST